jgi:hypothetical protein
MALNNPSLSSSLRNCLRWEAGRASPSAVTICAALPLRKSSLVMPALSTPGTDSTCSSTRL